MSGLGSPVTSNFEVTQRDIVIAKATINSHMVTTIPLRNIEEEQKADLRTAIELARILRFLRDIEQD